MGRRSIQTHKKIGKQIIEAGHREGFAEIKFLPAVNISREFRSFYKTYLRRGLFADLKYLKNIRAKFSIHKILKGATSIGVFVYPYRNAAVEEAIRSSKQNSRYQISRYAWRRDYHLVLKEKLEMVLSEALPDIISQVGPQVGLQDQNDISYRIVCDTTPLPERYLAALSGAGFIGRNAMLIHPEHGTYVLLAFVLFQGIDLSEIGENHSTEFADNPDLRHAHSPRQINPEKTFFDFKECGSCRACVKACPGQAILDDGYVDASRCWSYWSIENRAGNLPEDLHQKGVTFPGDKRIFGCDICQEVCPHNSEQGTVNREQGIVNSEEGTGNREQRTVNKERWKKKTANSEFSPCEIALKISAGEFDVKESEGPVPSLKGTAFERLRWKGLIRNRIFLR